MSKSNSPSGFSEAEREAMRARAKELAAEARFSKNRAQGKKDIMDAIANMSEADQILAKRIHDIVSTNAPELMPKTWYGMPAYAKDGKILCFIQAASKFQSRYATLGFNDIATLDEGNMWATTFAIRALTPQEEIKIAELLQRALD